MKYFKIDLPIMMRYQVLEDLKIDLFNSCNDVKRIPVDFKTAGGYITGYVAATYDIYGHTAEKSYRIRVYCRLDKNTRMVKPEYDRSRSNEKDGIYVYHMNFWEDDLQVYRLRERFPIIHDIELYPGIFCKYVRNPQVLTDIHGYPLCVDHGQPPVITLEGDDSIDLERGTEYVEPGYIAVDPEDGDLTSEVIVTTDLDNNTVGTYTIVYTVEDSDHNVATAYREVNVIHTNTAPVINLLGEPVVDVEIQARKVLYEWYTDELRRPGTGSTAGHIEQRKSADELVNIIWETVMYDISYNFAENHEVSESQGAPDPRESHTLTILAEDGTVYPDIKSWKLAEEPKFPDKFRVIITPNAEGSTPVFAEDVDIIPMRIWEVEEEDYSTWHTVPLSGTFDTMTTLAMVSGFMKGEEYFGYARRIQSGLRYVITEVPPPHEHGSFPNVTTHVFGGHGEDLESPVAPYPPLPEWTDPGATAYDEEEGDLTGNIATLGDTLDYTKPDTYSRRYRVVDSEGLADETSRTINIKARIPPTLIVEGLWRTVSVIKNFPITNPAATAYDHAGNDITNLIQISGTIDTSTPGHKQITYSVTDPDTGLEVTEIHNVVVYERFGPEITLNPNGAGDVNPITIPWKGTWTDPGATATDVEDGDLTNQIVVGGDVVNTHIERSYTITYSVTDSDGQSALVTREVIVGSNQAPLIQLLGDEDVTVEIQARKVLYEWYTDEYYKIGTGTTAGHIEQRKSVDELVNLIWETIAYNISYGMYGQEEQFDPHTEYHYWIRSANGTTYSNIKSWKMAEEPNRPSYFEVLIGPNHPSDAPATYVERVDIVPMRIWEVEEDDYSTHGTAPLSGTFDTMTTLASVSGYMKACNYFGYVRRLQSGIRYGIKETQPPHEPGGYPTVTTHVFDGNGEDLESQVDTWEALPPWTDPGAIATDPEDGNLTNSIVITGDQVDLSTPGTYVRNYKATDSAGVTTEITRNIHVKARIPPTIVVDGLWRTETVEYGVEYTQPTAIAYDSEGNDISNLIQVTGNVDTEVSGYYQLTYSVTDPTTQLTVTEIHNVVVCEEEVVVLPPTIALTGGDETYTRIMYTEAYWYLIGASGRGGGDVQACVGKYVINYIDIRDEDGNPAVMPPYGSLVGASTDTPGNAFDDSAGDGFITKMWFCPPGTPHGLFTCKGTSLVKLPYSFTMKASNIKHHNYMPPKNIGINSYQRLFVGIPPIPDNWSYSQTGPNIGNYDFSPGEIVSSTSETMSVIPRPAPLTWEESGYTASSGDGTVDLTSQVVITGDEIDRYTPGTYVRTYTVTDAGLTTTVTRTVTVLERDVPVVTPNGANPYIVLDDQEYVEPGASAINADGDNVFVGYTTEKFKPFNSSDDSERVYYAAEDMNLVGTAYRDIIYTQSPSIIILGDNPMTLPQNAIWNDPGATASDGNGNNISSDIITTGNVTTSVPASYNITYTVTDANGITVSVIRTVNVTPASNTAPIMFLNGVTPFEIEQHDTFVDPGATATDTEDGDLTDDIVATGNVDIHTPGDYNVTYTVTDSGGLTSQITRVVTVTPPPPNTPPIIALLPTNTGEMTNVFLDTSGTMSYTEPGATATDAEDGDLTDHLIIDCEYDINWSVGSSITGSYSTEQMPMVVEYSVTDSGGLSAHVKRFIWIGERDMEIEPSMTPYVDEDDNMVLLQGETWENPGYEINHWDPNESDGTWTITGDDLVDSSNPGDTFEITYEYTDSYGETAEPVTMTVKIYAALTTITLNEFNGETTPITLNVGDVYTEEGATAYDVENGDITDDIEIGGDTVDTTTPGTYTVTYHVDGRESADASRVVTVV